MRYIRRDLMEEVLQVNKTLEDLGETFKVCVTGGYGGHTLEICDSLFSSPSYTFFGSLRECRMAMYKYLYYYLAKRLKNENLSSPHD